MILDKVVYICCKKMGLVYVIFINLDIYVYDLNIKKIVNIIEGMMGYDINL